MKYLSLFSGIGGFEVGIHKVFPNAKCVGFSEVDKQAIETYQRHFPHHPYLGPVEDVKGPFNVDLIVGGSPCQDLSCANVSGQRGLQGKKSKLFWEFARIIKEHPHSYFILENVASMRLSQRDIISDVLGVKPVMINSKQFTAQNRKRLYWTNIPLSETLLNQMQHPQRFSDILVDRDKAYDFVIVEPEKKQLYISYLKKKEKYGSGLALEILDSNDELCKTLTTRRLWVKDHRINQMRKLHPIEAERLQSFPDGWVDNIKGYTKRMALLGNAVTCDVIQYIVSNLKK